MGGMGFPKVLTPFGLSLYKMLPPELICHIDNLCLQIKWQLVMQEIKDVVHLSDPDSEWQFKMHPWQRSIYFDRTKSLYLMNWGKCSPDYQQWCYTSKNVNMGDCMWKTFKNCSLTYRELGYQLQVYRDVYYCTSVKNLPQQIHSWCGDPLPTMNWGQWLPLLL